MGTKHKYLVTVDGDSKKVEKVEHVGEAGEMTEVKHDDEGAETLVMSPWPVHHPKRD